MTQRFGLKESVVESICHVLARHPEVEKAIIYGSRAKGTHKYNSDIDLTLIGDDRLTFLALTKIMDDLDDLLLPYMIDLSVLSHISDPDVIEHIRRVGAVFYERKKSE
jgi:predicted nucleotidyltransferase